MGAGTSTSPIRVFLQQKLSFQHWCTFRTSFCIGESVLIHFFGERLAIGSWGGLGGGLDENSYFADQAEVSDITEPT